MGRGSSRFPEAAAPTAPVRMLGAVGAPRQRRDAAEIGIDPARLSSRPGSGRPGPAPGGRRREVKLVRPRMSIAGYPARCRINDPEEASALEIEIAHLPVLRLAGRRADRVGPLGHDAPFLGGGKRLDLYRPHLEGGVDAEIVGRDGRGDEAGRRWLKGHGADLDPADDLVLQALVVDLDVVVAGEVALGCRSPR